jgi:ribosomal protein S18 acetylase RimI-like enzyme
VADVSAVLARQRALGVPAAFEWVHETSPDVDAAATGAGLHVQRCPLLVLAAPPPDVALPAGITVSAASPTDADLAAADAVASIAFGTGVTATAGPAERDAAARQVGAARVADVRARLAAGELVRAVVRDAGGPLAVGAYQHTGGVAEIVGVATLPSARRRGLAAAVTALLARHALAAGRSTVFLSAGDEEVARMYERVGFRRLATAGLAAPPGR